MSCGKKWKSDGRTYLFGGIDVYWSERRPKYWKYVLRCKMSPKKKALLWEKYVGPLETREFRIDQIEYMHRGLIGKRLVNGKVIKVYKKVEAEDDQQIYD